MTVYWDVLKGADGFPTLFPMKNITPARLRTTLHVTCALLCFLAFGDEANSQPAPWPDSLVSAAAFYPLEVGAEWVYTRAIVGLDRPPLPLETRRVIEARPFPNGHVYFKITRSVWNQPDSVSSFTFERVDTLTASVLRRNPELSTPDSVVDDTLYYLPTSPRSRGNNAASPPYVRCGGFSTTTLFGQIWPSWNCGVRWSGGMSNDYRMAYGIGVYYELFTFESFAWATLVYFRRDGASGGTPVSVGREPEPVNTSPQPVRIYPNPVQRGTPITIDTAGAPYRVFDMLGREWRSDTHRLPPGVYTVRLEDQPATQAMFVVL